MPCAAKQITRFLKPLIPLKCIYIPSEYNINSISSSAGICKDSDVTPDICGRKWDLMPALEKKKKHSLREVQGVIGDTSNYCR